MPPTAEANVCNLALARVGQRQFITALTDTSASGLLCAVLYPQARDALLSGFPWRFATKHATLTVLTGTRSGWTYAYSLPTDCVEPQYVFNGGRPGQPALPLPIGLDAALLGVTGGSYLPTISGELPSTPFEIEASDDGTTRILLCDQVDAELVYTFRAAPPFPVPFTEALAWRLAVDLSLSLTVKPQVASLFEQKAAAALSAAKMAALNSRQQDALPDSPYISVRG